MKASPNYHRIYTDIIDKRFPHLKDKCEWVFKKEVFSALDIIYLNKTIFGKATVATENFNQRHRSYDRADIIEILNYQKKNNLNNKQLSVHYKISRNTIAKWKKYF